jgi:uncharacterized protein YjbI with pentapeptide repeats
MVDTAIPLDAMERALLTDPLQLGEVARFSFSGRRLSELTLRGVAFQGGSWRGTELARVRFEGCTFVGVTFHEAALDGVLFSHCDFSLCRFVGGSLADTTFEGGSIHDAIVRDAKLALCRLVGVDAQDVRIEGAELSLVVRGGALSSWLVSGCKLGQLIVSDASVRFCRLSACTTGIAAFQRCPIEELELRGGSVEELHVLGADASGVRCVELQAGSLTLESLGTLLSLHVSACSVAELALRHVAHAHDLYIADSTLAELELGEARVAGWLTRSSVRRGSIHEATLVDWFWDDSELNALSIAGLTLVGGMSTRNAQFTGLRLGALHVPPGFEWAHEGVRYQDSDRFPSGAP